MSRRRATRRLRDLCVGGLAGLGLRAFGALSRPRAVALGGWMGRSYARLGGPRTAVARKNLRIAFPEWSDAEREAVLVRSFERLGQGAAEIAHLGALDRDSVGDWVTLEGLENLEAAQARGRGVIILTGHFGSWELFAGACAIYGLPFSIVYREQRNARLDRLVSDWRRARGVDVIRRGSAARAALRALRAGRLVATPLDQDTRIRDGVFAPFFGRPASTRDAPARLAMHTGAPVVPAFLFRIDGGLRHAVRFSPALDLVPAGEDRDKAICENVARMNEALESAIRGAPDHWIWTHRRWRTQPEGLANPYREPRV